MNIALWIVQVLLALVFGLAGGLKLFAFEKYAKQAPALADNRRLVTFIGLCEVAGAIGVVFPQLTGILPVLTPWAALGLAAIMALATGFHLLRREFSHLALPILLFVLALFVLYGRGFYATMI